MKKIACVTGATGFIGTHLVRDLLASGHTVRCAVRDSKNLEKTAHLFDIAKELNATDRLTTHSASLEKAGDFDHIIEGCHWVFHLASAVKTHAEDPIKDIIDVSVDGTKNVLRSVEKSSSVQGLAITSSITAVLSLEPKPGYTYTEDDWFDGTNPYESAYPISKAKAEQAVWDFHKKLSNRKLTVLVVNPALVIGKPYCKHHISSSLRVIEDLILGRYKGAPNLGYGLVDVGDVVKVLKTGLEKGITGRYNLQERSMWLKEMIAVIKNELSDRNIPDRHIPSFLLYLRGFVKGKGAVANLKRTLGREDLVSSDKAKKDFDLTFQSIESSLQECCRSLCSYL